MPERTSESAFRTAEATYHASLGVSLDEKWLDVPGWGKRARYLEVGSGPAVLMVHGGGAVASQWTPLVPLLDRFRLIIPDRPGFGLSEYVDYRGIDLQEHAVEFLTAVLDHSGAATASVVANSMGGLWSLWLALSSPERVDRLALLGTPARLLETSAPGGMRLLGIPGLNRMMMGLESPSERQVRTLFKRMGHDPNHACSPEMIELVVRSEELPHFKDAWLTLLQNVLPFSRINPAVGISEGDLARVSQPVLYVWGSEDPFGALDVARRAEAATPDATLKIMGQGHLPWLDGPEECGKVVRDFLRGTAPRGAVE